MFQLLIFPFPSDQIHNQLMISYCNPICTVTNQRATIFCCTETCNNSAFACSSGCLLIDHPDHHTSQWSAIQQPVRLAIERPLTKEELFRIQKQEKQLKILSEELNALQISHEQIIKQFKQRLQLKGIAEKILSAVRSKSTQGITGSDMAQFVKSLKEDDMFANKKKVAAAMGERNLIIQEMYAKLLNFARETQLKMQKLPKPEHLLDTEQVAKSGFTPDLANISDWVIVSNNNIITVKTGHWTYHSVFARQPLNDGQTFQIQVTKPADRTFLIGVAPAQLRNKTDAYKHNDSMCVSVYEGKLYSDGRQQQLVKLTIKAGDRLALRRDLHSLQWLHNGVRICTDLIPNRLRDGPLYPVCWIRSAFDSAKLQFGC